MRIAIGFLAAACCAQDAADVAKVFASNCIGCHSSAAKMGGLDLQTAAAAKQGGKSGAVIVPGHSEQSKLYLMMAGKVQPAMPVGGKVAAGDLDAVKRWIDAGAPGTFELATAPKAPVIKPASAKPQIFSLAYSPDGAIVATGGWREVRLRPSDTVFTEPADAVRALAFSKDGRLLAAAGGVPGVKGEVLVYDVAAKKLATRIEGHADSIYGLTISPDGKIIATSSYDKLIKLWDSATGKEIRTLKDHIDAVYALEWTPDGKRLVSGAADRTLKIWDPATGERLFTLGEPADGINTVAIDPTGRYVAAGGLDKSIRIWELEARSGRLLRTQIAHEDAILKLAWSPDGSTLVSSSADKTIKVFRVSDLADLRTIGPQPDWVYGLAFTPDGKKFAAGRYDGSLEMYERVAP